MTRAKTVLHYPRLDTILMVEETIRKAKTEYTKTGLWKSLPRQTQYQTLKLILEYLEQSNKITFDDGKIIWIASNKKLDLLVKSGKRY